MTEFIKNAYLLASLYMQEHHKEIKHYKMSHEYDDENRILHINIKPEVLPALNFIEVTITV